LSTLFDLTILIVAIIFAALGAKDGLIREIFRFGALLGGFFAGFCYYPDLQPHLRGVSSNPQAVNFLSFVIIFIAVAVTILILGFIVRKLIKVALLGWADRFMGFAFGLLKAGLITWVVCLTISMLPQKQVKEKFGGSVVYSAYEKLPSFFSLKGIEDIRNKIRSTADAGAEKIQAANSLLETLVNSIDKNDSLKTDAAPSKPKEKK
jgi:membrane protein required for colicin V production